ncbi:MAG: hypothetical protein ACQER0_03175 [Bacillota bacterium]
MNKAMLCTLKNDNETKKILIVKNKIEQENLKIEVDQQLEDQNPDVQNLIKAQVTQTLKLNFLAEKDDWKLINKKMYISNFDYAYDLSSLKSFINSLIKIKINDQEIDLAIIELLKNDILAASDFWENENIDQDLTAELILKYWDLKPVNSYPENNYYKKLMQLADNKIEIIDQEIVNYWPQIPTLIKDKINNLVNKGELKFQNYLYYLKTRKNPVFNRILFNLIQEKVGESQASINNLFEKFHYQLIDELTKQALEKNKKLELKPVIPAVDSRKEEIKENLKLIEYSLVEIFKHYSIKINFEDLNLFADNKINSTKEYMNALSQHVNYLNQLRNQLNCKKCGQRLDYDLDYSKKTAVYKVKAARCNNLKCDNFKEELEF